MREKRGRPVTLVMDSRRINNTTSTFHYRLRDSWHQQQDKEDTSTPGIVEVNTYNCGSMDLDLYKKVSSGSIWRDTNPD